MKALVNSAWRLVIIITIAALTLTGCETKDNYPEWYNDSIFMPLYDNPYDQLRAPKYQISDDSPAAVEITYSEDIIDGLISRALALEIVMIGYKIIGDQPPTETKSEVITSIRMPSELSDGDGSYLPLQRKINVEDWLPENTALFFGNLNIIILESEMTAISVSICRSSTQKTVMKRTSLKLMTNFMNIRKIWDSPCTQNIKNS